MKTSVCLSATLTGVLILGACTTGSSDRPAAKVNGQTILVSDLRMALDSVGGDATDTQQVDMRQVLEGLIERELLAQHALKAELEKTPGIQQAIEMARKQILAQGYIERVWKRYPPTQLAAEVSSYYAQNRSSFEQRRLYRLFELGISAPEATLRAVKAKAAGMRNINELVEWLKARKIAFNVGGTAKFSEQLPESVRSRLVRMSEGEIQVVDAPGGVSIIQLLQWQKASLTEEQAAPMIEQLLIGRSRAHAAAEAIKKLRERADIQYVALREEAGKEPVPSMAAAASKEK